MIRVLIVEDSPVQQELLARILGSDPQIQVVGFADDGEMALSAVARLKPDLITMDINMPNLNGFDTTRQLMETQPLPIIIVSGSYSADDVDKAFRAIEAGALAIVRKPHGMAHPEYPDDARELIKIVKTMSEVKVVRRWPRLTETRSLQPLLHTMGRLAPPKIRVVAIGASTGGPPVLQKIFSGLPKDYNVPLMAVQHMAKGFMEGFVAWLSNTTGFPAHIATHGEPLLPGCAYFAPDGFHLMAGRDNQVVLSSGDPESGLCPSVACLFRSVAEVFGPNAAGVLLTGMGRDGADDLKLLKEKGAITIVQNQESSVIFGMPGEAVKLNAAEYILAPEKIAELLTQLVKAKGFTS